MEIRVIPFQQEIIGQARDLTKKGHKRIILQADTGAGKTACACFIIRAAAAKGAKVLFIASARKLVYQASAMLKEFGVPHGIIMAGLKYDLTKNVQVIAKETAVSRAIRNTKLSLPDADLVFADECHEVLSKGFKALLARWPNAIHLGLSGTPSRLDGKDLSEFYTAMACAPPTSELIRLGAILPGRVFAPPGPNLKGIRFNKDGEARNKKELSRRVNTGKLVGDIVQHWLDIGQGRPTVCFAQDVDHSISIRDKFVEAGIDCMHIDADSDDAQRDEAIAGLQDGSIKIVCNVGVWVQGVDIPEISCGILAKVSASLRYYRQAIGRLKRPCPWTGKQDYLLLDHASMVWMHGLPDDDIEWKLGTDESVQDRQAKRIEEGKVKQALICPKCHCAFSGRRDCPNCGHIMKRVAKDRETLAGRLEEVTQVQERSAEAIYEDKVRLWKWCIGIAIGADRKCSAAAHMYKQKTGEPPWHSGIEGLPFMEEWQMNAKDWYNLKKVEFQSLEASLLNEEAFA